MELHKVILGEIDIDPSKLALLKPGICPVTLLLAISTFRKMKSEEICKGANPLMAAVGVGSLELVKWLIEEGADVNEGRINGLGLLSWALSKEHYEIASYLIKSGALVNSLDELGIAPILYAINKNSPVYIVKELLSKGVSADDVCRNSSLEIKRPILKAIRENNIPVVKFLLEQSVQVNFPLICIEDVSALTLAVICNSIESVKLLIDYGAKINGQNDEFPNPIFAAVGSRNITALRILVSAGANVNKAYVLNRSIQRKIGTDEPDLTALHMAVLVQDCSVIQELLNAGADINKATLVERQTPLNFICSLIQTKEDVLDGNESDCKIVRLLLNNGADMYTRDKHYNSPALNCLAAECYSVLKELIDAGIDVNLNIGFGGSILMYITVKGVSNYVKLCLEHGGDGARRSKNIFKNLCAYESALKHGFDIAKLFFPYHPVDGFTPSKIGCRTRRGVPALNNQFKYFDGIKKNSERVVIRALQNGAEARAFLIDMRFPIFFPVTYKNIGMLKILLDRGVCPNVQNEKKETPLHVAAQKGFTEGCYDLLQHGACYNIKCSAGRSPLETAVLFSENQQVRRLLKDIHLVFLRAKKGKVNLIKELLSKKPDAEFFSCINCVNRKGNTLLQEVILSGSFQMAEAIMTLRLNRAPK